MFRIGQRVVCIDARPTVDGWAVPLVERKTYVITEIVGDYTYRDPEYGHVLGFSLAGVPTLPPRVAILPSGWRVSLDGRYASIRFRPVVEKKTDIAIFTSLLNPADHRQLEDA